MLYPNIKWKYIKKSNYIKKIFSKGFINGVSTCITKGNDLKRTDFEIMLVSWLNVNVNEPMTHNHGVYIRYGSTGTRRPWRLNKYILHIRFDLEAVVAQSADGCGFNSNLRESIIFISMESGQQSVLNYVRSAYLDMNFERSRSIVCESHIAK